MQSVELSAASWLLEDKNGALTIDDVRSVEYGNRFQFRPPSTIGWTTSVYWLRFTLANDSSSQHLWWLDAGDRYQPEISLFAPGATGTAAYVVHTIRKSNPYASRAVLSPNAVFPVVIPSGQTVQLYLRVDSGGINKVRIRPVLWQPDAFRVGDQENRVAFAIYLGAGAAFALFNLFVFFAVRERVYAYYVMALLGNVLLIDSSPVGLGLIFTYLWPNNLSINTAMIFISVYGGFVLNAIFLTNLGEVSWRYLVPHAYRLGKWWFLVMFPLICLLASFHVLQVDWSKSIYMTLIKIFLASMACYALGFVITIVRLAWTGQGMGRLVLIGWLPMGIYAATAPANELSVFLSGYMIPLGLLTSGFEMLIMSLALAVRLQKERNEKALAQSALIEGLQRSERELEIKVDLRTRELQAEKQRASELLHNILPAEVIKELSSTGRVSSSRYESATILFTDFSGFTQAAATMPPDRMVAELNEIFAAFDDICEEIGVEKIKTIGDAYMAVAGLPTPCSDHAQRCVRAGLRMTEYLAQRNKQSAFKWFLRVGIHSGSVVAGVVGKRKYAFDIWGDAVNVASRLESSGEVGKVNVSAYTYDLVQHEFECEYRGKVGAKGKGEIDMYFVIGQRATVSDS